MGVECSVRREEKRREGKKRVLGELVAGDLWVWSVALGGRRRDVKGGEEEKERRVFGREKRNKIWSIKKEEKGKERKEVRFQERKVGKRKV